MSSCRVVCITVRIASKFRSGVLVFSKSMSASKNTYSRYELLDHLKTGLEDSKETSAYVGELIGQPGKNRNRTEGDDSQGEVETEFVGLCVCDATQDGVSMHLSKDPDYASAEEEKQKSETPVNELMGLEGIRVPRDDGEYEGRADEEHEVANIHEHRPDERNVTDYQQLFR